MTAKSVLLRPQGLCPKARAPTCPRCYATGSTLDAAARHCILGVN